MPSPNGALFSDRQPAPRMVDCVWLPPNDQTTLHVIGWDDSETEYDLNDPGSCDAVNSHKFCLQLGELQILTA